MARRVILDTQYTFTPSTKTVVIPRVVPQERLLLITNVTTNKVIYNFSDPTLTATSYAIAQNTNTTNATTTVVLTYNTTAMSSTDKLSIVVDEIAESFVPDEAYIDPVGKLRVSTPQALIDTDFEYGLQPTKWETLTLLNNRPSFFVNTQTALTITGVSAVNNSSLVTVLTTAVVTVGTPVLIQDTTFSGANGPFVITSVNAGVSFSYQARYAYPSATGTIYNSALTQVYTGSFYTGAAYTLPSQPTYSGQTITVTTTEPHGLQVGDSVVVTGATATTNPPNGTWYVAAVPTATTFQYIANFFPTGTIAAAVVYPNPTGWYLHRAFDGGVQFSTGSSGHNLQTIRQTRRYFRYQSGKGIQVSTGTILKPSITVDDMSASGTTVTVQTKYPHYISPNITITVFGANESAYNGTFKVDSVIDAYRFTYIAASTPTVATATGYTYLSIVGWSGARNRLGLFDQQNGMFFEHDGTTLWAVRRRSVDQIGGAVNVTNGSATVTGVSFQNTSTKFSKQLSPGDYVVIRGMSYRVMNIASDISMTISPPYRGSTLSGLNTAIVSKTIEVRVPQSQWNMDKCDGTGPSGFNLDVSKMQMYYMDYSWYGAGTLRFGFRDTTGKVFYCHRFVNSNQNTEAWMRSGNLPGRYETNTFANTTQLAANMLIGDTTMTVSSTAGFNNSGVLLIDDAGASGFEYVGYTGISGNTFTGLTRGKATSTITTAVSTTANVGNITTTSSVSGIQLGQYVYQVGGNAIPQGTYVANIYTGATNTITLTQAPTETNAASTLSFVQMGSAAAAHTYSNTAPVAIYQHSPSFSPTISHWGTSVIMDGGFDNDKSLQFIYGETTVAVIGPGATVPLMSLRVSPAVDSGVPSTLGAKEIINRMQLTMQQLEVLTNGSFLVYLVLNGNITANTGQLNSFARIATGTSSLAQIADHTGNVAINGGENIYGFYAVNSAGSTNSSIIQGDLTKLRDIGNSILGGGTSNTPNTNVYPDGPDVVTVVAQNVGAANSSIQARISWTEAQA